MTVHAATARTFRVHWYEVERPRHLFDAATATPRALPTPNASRKSSFDVEARTLDRAKALAVEHLRKRGAIVHCVNYGTRPAELFVYTRKT